jgi:hypothetical protein
MSGVQFVVLMAGGWKFWKEGEKKPVTLAFGTLLLVYVSFWFTYKEPLAHIYYVLIPVVMLYSFYVYRDLADKTLWRNLALLCLLASVWLWGGYSMENRTAPYSLYTNRDLVQKAITGKNYQLLGERRPQSLY